MPIPILFVGIAAITGATGLGTTVKAGFDHKKAKKINKNSEERIQLESERLNELRFQCGSALERLGEQKIFVLKNNMERFLELFSKIKNVDFTEVEYINNMGETQVDDMVFEEIRGTKKVVSNLIGDSAVGLTSGALTAIGAYNLATMFASASTGTAISSLSGAAASNATLAFFGGGSLATGGLGVAGGTAVLGGLVAGPALLCLGVLTGIKASKDIEIAKMNAAETDLVCEQLSNGISQCIRIRRQAYIYHNILSRLDVNFLPLIYDLEKILDLEGEDYSKYAPESKKTVSRICSLAVTIKSVLDTSIIEEDGALNDKSIVVANKAEEYIESFCD